MNTDKPNYLFINWHLIGIIRDISDECPEKVMPIWVEVTTESIDMFTGDA